MAKTRRALSPFRRKAAEAARNALAASTPAHRAGYRAQEKLWLQVAVSDEKRRAGNTRRPL